MTVSRTRWSPTGAVWAALIFAPGICSAQSTGETGSKGGSNLTRQTQNEIGIALPSLAPLVERVTPAVVNISVELKEQAATQSEGDTGNESASPLGPGGTPFDQFLKRFFEQPFQFRNPAEKVMALGSAFIIDPAGYIVTNNHVLANADKVTVFFQDNSRHTAKVIGRDEKTDIALLKIDTSQKLPYVTWGNSDDAKVGDWVVAVGNPFGLGGSVTAGIISALGRDINEGPYDDFLQIDAPINRGNSGGPTFNLHGQVIGINTAIYSPSGGSVGIGFALPSNTAKNVIQQLRQHSHVTWGWLGVAIQTITPTIAKSLGMDPDQPAGALVASVTPNSPAVKAGIKPGDVILSAEGQPIKTVHDLPRLVANTSIGKKIDLQVRRGGKDMTLSATIGELQETQQAAAAADNTRPEKTSSLGLQLSSIDPGVRRQFRIPKEVEGAVVAEVAPDSPAAALGLEPGDVIESVDQQPVKTPQQAAEALQQASSKGNILLLLNRHGTSQFVGLTVTPNTGPNSGSSGNPG